MENELTIDNQVITMPENKETQQQNIIDKQTLDSDSSTIQESNVETKKSGSRFRIRLFSTNW